MAEDANINANPPSRAAPGSGNYLQCRCYICDWEDGFLEELIDADGEVDGYCDQCGRERGFYMLRSPNTELRRGAKD